jgi:hypothetical protein
LFRIYYLPHISYLYLQLLYLHPKNAYKSLSLAQVSRLSSTQVTKHLARADVWSLLIDGSKHGYGDWLSITAVFYCHVLGKHILRVLGTVDMGAVPDSENMVACLLHTIEDWLEVPGLLLRLMRVVADNTNGISGKVVCAVYY